MGGRTISLHRRGAADTLLDMLEFEGLAARFVLHWFSAKPALVKRADFLEAQVRSPRKKARHAVLAAGREAAMTGDCDVLVCLHLAGADQSDAFGFARGSSPAGRLQALLSSNHQALALRSRTGTLRHFLSCDNRNEIIARLIE